MLQWVVLHHTLPDGSSHYDWLLEPAEDAPLISLRVPARLSPGTFPIERLPDHRRIYLTFQGEISGGRGTVTRIQQGTLLHIAASSTTVEAQLRDDQHTWHLSATQHQVHVTQQPPSSP